MPDDKSLDVLGLKPISDAINKITSAAVDGANAFLSRICLPAAEEYGLYLRDKVHHWRTQNMLAVTQKAEATMVMAGLSDNVHAHPRLISTILDQGSWIEDAKVQEMWGGLLASSCTESGDDDSNLLFIDLLGSLTKLQ